MSESKRCAVSFVIDFDSIGCNLEAGHEGAHEDNCEGGWFTWDLKEPDTSIEQARHERALAIVRDIAVRDAELLERLAD